MRLGISPLVVLSRTVPVQALAVVLAVALQGTALLVVLRRSSMKAVADRLTQKAGVSPVLSRTASELESLLAVGQQ